MLGFGLEVVARTDVGRVRMLNEDGVLADGACGIAVVADGMGGHRAGEVASKIALETVSARLRRKMRRLEAGVRRQSPADAVRQAVAAANEAVFRAARSRPDCQGMGTTLALVAFHGRRATLAHVGDSRIYRLRDGRLTLLTRDDSLLTDQVELGLISADDASDSHNRHLVTRALGVSQNVKPHLREEAVASGDVFLLCSDGLHDMVEEADIELIISALKTNLPMAAAHLVQLANDNGGLDNVSAVLVRVLDASAAGGWWARIRRVFGGRG